MAWVRRSTRRSRPGFRNLLHAAGSNPADVRTPPDERASMPARVLGIPDADVGPVLWAFAQFACVLTATFVVRSVRDQMGIAGGVRDLPWLFTGTFAATLALVPLFGWAAARLGRAALATAIYGGLGLSMLVLAFAEATTAADMRIWVARAAFVWLSVINMIAVATFWSVVVDVFDREHAPRAFGVVAAGGTVGALAGPALALVLAPGAGAATLLVVSAVAWVLAVVCGRGLERSLRGRIEVVGGARRVGGSILAGLVLLVRSRRLRGVAIYVLAFTATSTVLYLAQGDIVARSIADDGERRAFFARIDLVVNVIAVVVQVTMTGRILARVPLPIVLAVLPVLTVVVLLVLGQDPTLAVLTVVMSLRRASEHAVAKPGRELLYLGMDREAKFKGQAAVDTVVYRGGDAASAWLVEAIGRAGVGIDARLWSFVPVAVLWTWLGVRLGRDATSARSDAPTP